MASWVTGSCDVNGVTIHYTRTGGQKPPLLLLHGLLGNGACWTPVAGGLEAELEIVMPDARGHGHSSAPSEGYRYEDHAGDVLGLLRALDLASPVVLGHSMGGMTAAVVASRLGLQLRGLVLVDPTFLTPERQREVYASDVADQHRRLLSLGRSALAAELRARPTRRSPEMVDRLIEARAQTRLAAFEVLRPPNPDYRALIRTIVVPTLLVIGDAPVVSVETAGELERLNPRLRVAQVAEAGHGLPFDQPARLADLVATFVSSLP